VALTELVSPPAIEPLLEPLPSCERLGGQLTRLLEIVWTPRWLKAPAKKLKPPAPRQALRGGQTSVSRLLTAYRQNKPEVTALTQ
jgi:hypothetical protein